MATSWQRFCAQDNNDSYLYANVQLSACYRQKLCEFRACENMHRQLPKASYVQCRKCNSNLIWLDVLQVRSGDEGATTFAECSNCKFKWTMN